MSVCPFCKAPVQVTTAPCPRCGKLASDHPSIAAVQGRTLSTDFDDEPVGDLSLGGSEGAGGHGQASAASFDGGGVTFDDDLFGDGGGGPLELDVPSAPHSGTTTSGAVRVAGTAERDDDPFDSVPDLPVPPPSSRRTPESGQQRPSGSHPLPGNSGTLPAARPSAASDPRISAPALPAPPPSSSSPALGRAPAPSSGRLEAASSPGLGPESGEVPIARGRPAPPPPDPGALVVARYPAPPGALLDMPGYACRVFLRQLEIRRDLESLRRRRSPDVALYEAALRAHDARAFAIGMTITCAAVFLGTLVFFSPVIARFLRAD